VSLAAWARRVVAGVLAAVLAGPMLAGCATPQRPDPLEPMNRKIFAFNEAVDAAVLKPVATAYKEVVPSPVRTAVGNFFGNVRDGWSAINLFLQGRLFDGLNETLRVATNTVFGIFGLLDIATEAGLERHNEDFGQTLGVWGFGPGPYLVLPFLGPSSGRDVIGLPPEFYFTPERHLAIEESSRYLLSGVKVVDTRASLLDASKLLDEVALDKYAFLRNAYLQRRRSLIYNGNPPEEEPPDDSPSEPEERYDLPEAPAPAASR
jgi:phospholipid-binding lipoprotein MlaA